MGRLRCWWTQSHKFTLHRQANENYNTTMTDIEPPQKKDDGNNECLFADRSPVLKKKKKKEQLLTVDFAKFRIGGGGPK